MHACWLTLYIYMCINFIPLIAFRCLSLMNVTASLRNSGAIWECVFVGCSGPDGKRGRCASSASKLITARKPGSSGIKAIRHSVQVPQPVQQTGCYSCCCWRRSQNDHNLLLAPIMTILVLNGCFCCLLRVALHFVA